MDLNLTVISGRLASPPEIRQFESGARMARYLVTVRTEEPTLCGEPVLVGFDHCGRAVCPAGPTIDQED